MHARTCTPFRPAIRCVCRQAAAEGSLDATKNQPWAWVAVFEQHVLVTGYVSHLCATGALPLAGTPPGCCRGLGSDGDGAGVGGGTLPAALIRS